MADLNRIKNEGIAAQINSNARQNPNPFAGITYWVTNYHEPREGADAAQDMRVILNADPSSLEGIASGLQAQHITNVLQEVRTDPRRVYRNTSPDFLLEVADRFLGSAEYKALRTALQNNNGVGPAFMALYPASPILASVISTASEDAVRKGAINAVARIRKRELVTNHIVNATSRTVDMSGAAAYDASKVAALPTAQRDAHYVELGMKYAEIKDPTHFR